MPDAPRTPEKSKDTPKPTTSPPAAAGSSNTGGSPSSPSSASQREIDLQYIGTWVSSATPSPLTPPLLAKELFH
ncbi:uncharacterized protein N7482_008718 [Penicillium canariense]|uniref:Uncharacterized protein n=1 Tax=Penicillium canariense TaxID=189055 RepID=A0A9W9LIT5_9EURO|nr:uncharacterized protein N7482_008718 [Penicillium canariense]KAJ5157618.1 hypothetical protein N7482_008718 [Penicillium canariense]